MVKLSLTKQDKEKLDNLFDTYNRLLSICKRYKGYSKEAFMLSVKELEPKLPEFVYKTLYDNFTVVVSRKGINITGYCKLYKRTVNIKGLGYFDIEGIDKSNKLVHSYYLNTDSKEYWIEITYVTKSSEPHMVGIDVGSERTFITNEGHIVKHVGTKRDMERYIETKKPKYLTRMENKREEILDALCDYYANRYDSIAIEDLHTNDTDYRITNTLFRYDNIKLIDQAIKRQSWHLLFDKLEKRDDIRVYRVPPEYTSQICNNCGVLNKKSRNKTIWKCKSCGHEDDADVNAAKNIKDRGVVVKNEGEIDLYDYRRVSKKSKYKKYRKR